MRVSLVLAFLCVACGVAHAEGTQPPASADQSGVTVNLSALPIPTPRFKPSPDEMRPLAQVRPRFKPEPESVVAGIPLPRPKPAMEMAAVAPAQAVAPPAATPPAATPPTAQPTAAPAMPVTIVEQPTYNFPVEISGVAQDPNASRKPINPLEGFAVLSRVRFSNGKTDVPAQARAALDILAQRLLSSQARVRLAAFSGKAGDASSEARRLSLARALAIRSYLVAKGVAVDRVDVLAFGGATDGISDRVDVLVRGI